MILKPQKLSAKDQGTKSVNSRGKEDALNLERLACRHKQKEYRPIRQVASKLIRQDHRLLSRTVFKATHSFSKNLCI